MVRYNKNANCQNIRLPLFSCEDAAQQVLMSSVRVCVRVSVVNLKIYLPTSFYNIYRVATDK